MRKFIAAPRAAVASAIVVLAVLVYLSVHTGVVQDSRFGDEVFFISRLPRTLAVLLSGAGLAVGGLVMQMIVHNRFVEPNTTGTSEGAAIGLLISMIFFNQWPLFARMGFASLCAMLSMFAFIRLARALPFKDPLLLPLVGMIYAGILEAGMTFFAYQYELLQVLQVWTNGDFSAVLNGRYEWLWGCALLIALLYLLADQLSIIGMGEKASHSLGLNYRQLVLIGILLVAMMTAFIVSTVGMIAFLGLLVPNIVRRFCGDHLRQALPWVAWTGAALLLLCDLLARTVNAPYEIPVSLIYGTLGSGLFLFLLLKRGA